MRRGDKGDMIGRQGKGKQTKKATLRKAARRHVLRISGTRYSQSHIHIPISSPLQSTRDFNLVRKTATNELCAFSTFSWNLGRGWMLCVRCLERVTIYVANRVKSISLKGISNCLPSFHCIISIDNSTSLFKASSSLFVLRFFFDNFSHFSKLWDFCIHVERWGKGSIS